MDSKQLELEEEKEPVDWPPQNGSDDVPSTLVTQM